MRSKSNPYAPVEVHTVTGYFTQTPCDPGDVNNPATGQCTDSPPLRADAPKNTGKPECPAGNPCNPATGNKYQVEVDYRGSGAFPLHLQRYYNSQLMRFTNVGQRWRHNFSAALVPGASSTRVVRPEGTEYVFNLVAGVWTADADVSETLTREPDGSWKLTLSTDEVERYHAAGRLVSITNRAGVTQSLTYDAQGRLLSVADANGRALTFHYTTTTSTYAAKMIDPQGNEYRYGYDSIGALVSVTFVNVSSAAQTTRTYHYNESAFVSGANLPYALTGITDENGVRFATYQYHADGRAKSTEHAGGAERVTLTYNADGTTTVQDALSQSRTYSFATILGVRRLTGISGPACPTCGPASVSHTASGYRQWTVDWNSNRTNYTHNARGLETQRVEGLTSAGATTAVSRTITTEWHPTYRLPTRIAEPSRITALVYGEPTDPPGTRGSLLTKTVQATTDTNGSQGFSASLVGTARTWTYTYNANGQVLTVDGPRTDVTDVTTYTYHADNATCTGASVIGCRGQVHTVTNAVGQVTTVSEYNAHGQPVRITDPNGVVTTLAYDGRTRLTSRMTGGEMTTYTYDNVGQLTRVTLPDGTYLNYTYDAAHRLTRISDNSGNRIDYTLDLMGNRTAEQAYDPSGALAQTRTRVYSNLNRLQQEIGAANQTVTYGYDNQGNVTSVDGALTGAGDTTANTYDALNRLIRVTDPAAGQVNYGYDGLDRLVSVTDPRNLTTTYNYDGLGDLKQIASPDTGTTVNSYDAAGNLATSTDAKGQVTAYTYDALNRVASIAYGTVTHTYQYDQGAYGKGRLTRISEPDITTDYAYDAQGRVTTETRTIAGVAHVTRYTYDAFGRLTRITYPSGREISYTLDNAGRVQQITTMKGGLTQTLVSGVGYRPFGAPKSFTFGNGQTYTRGFNLDGQITSYTNGTLTIPLDYDAAGRITSLGNGTYNYDVLDRLIQATTTGGTQAFTYDAVGNRSSKTGETYTYSATSNRLSSVSGTTSRTYSYDANGSPTSDGARTFAYDPRGRLTQSVSSGLTTDYKVNALGQRIRKTNSQGDILYHYDVQGRLIAESTSNGAAAKQYVYLGDMLVAMVTEGTATTLTPSKTVYSGAQATGIAVTVTVNGTAPAGTVTFYSGSTFLGTASVSGGTASFTLTNLPAGLHTITAVYSGDAVNAPSLVSLQVRVIPAWLPAVLDLLLN
jgi:YD repeat-containing protein